MTVDRATKLSRGPDSGLIYREQSVSQAVDRVWVMGVSEYGSEFVYDLNSEFLVFFSSWILWLYKEVYCPHVLDHVIE